MSWSELKIHKQSASHLLQELRLGETDFATTTPVDGADAFQVTSLCQADPAATTTFQAVSQLHDEFTATEPSPPGHQEQDALAGTEQNLGDQRGLDKSTDTGPNNREPSENKFNDLLCALTTGLEELGHLRENVLKNSADDLLKLVLSIARQVVHCEITADPKIIISTLQRALQVSINSSEYFVKVHPDDLATVMEKKPLFLASVNGLENITIEADESLTPGGCLVESELGQVDASIEGQFEELRQQLLPTLVTP